LLLSRTCVALWLAQKMTLRRDAGQGGGMAMRHLADDKERRLDMKSFENVQDFVGMGVGAVIEGQRDGVGMDQAGMEDGLGLEQRQFRAVAAGGGRRRRAKRHQQRHAQKQSNLFHVRPLATTRI
jgi:hypothetical protein